MCTVAYYVSSHGLGHAARSLQIMQALPPEINLWIKSAAPEWFFLHELHRPFNFIQDSFDCGALENERHVIDREITLQTYSSIAMRNAARLETEVEWLREIDASMVISDVPSFPLAAAVAAGIPSATVCNFTWVEIYRPYLKQFPQYAEMVEAMQAQYAMADVAFVTPLDLPMPYFPTIRRMPLAARRGRNRREEMAEAFGLDSNKPWILCYAGNLGLRFRWRTLEELSAYQFLTFSPIKKGVRPRNLLQLEQGRFTHPEVVASVDGVVSKAGYGMAGECMASGTPILYTDRDHFAEFTALDRSLQEWGGGIKIPVRDFAGGRWQAGLEKLLQRTPPTVPDVNGGEAIAREVIAMMNKLAAR